MPVANNEAVNSHTSFSFLENKKAVKPLTVDGRRPAVDNPNYPILRPLYLVTPSVPCGPVADYLGWPLGAAGQAVVKGRFLEIP